MNEINTFLVLIICCPSNLLIYCVVRLIKYILPMCQDIKSSLFSWSFNHWAYSIVQDKWHQQLRCLLINIPSTIRHQTWPPWNTNDQNRLMSLQAYFDFSTAAKYFSASPSFTIVSFSLLEYFLLFRWVLMHKQNIEFVI